MPEEIEVKLRIGDPKDAKKRVLAIAELFKKRYLEIDQYFDNNNTLKQSSEVLRLRDNRLLTYKKLKTKETFKIAEEVEAVVDNGNNVTYILAKLGYMPTKRKEKYRETFVCGKTIITIDETPMGNFIEVEGTKESVKNVAKKLGFSEKSFITETYGELWNAYKKKHNIKGDMVFRNVSH